LQFCAHGFAEPDENLTSRLLSQGEALKPLSGYFSVKITRQHSWLLPVMRDISLTEWKTEYLRLFSGRALCSPYETSYGDGRRLNGRPVELADINGFYSAFGFELSRDKPDLADHIGIEMEFLSLLYLKRAFWASYPFRHEAARTAQRAIRAFLSDHAGRWLFVFLHNLQTQGAHRFYVAMAQLAKLLIDQLCREEKCLPRLILPDEMVEAPQEEEAMQCLL
jgi:TorA maturation chaperone TorD